MNILLRMIGLLVSLFATSLSFAADDCMATYDGQSLTVPCINVSGSETLYQAELTQQAPEQLSFLATQVQATEMTTMTPVTVETIDVHILESFPVQIRVTVKGRFNDGCGRIEEVNIRREQQQFFVNLLMPQPSADIACIQVITPFEYSINLPVQSLKAGVYTVDVNGVTQDFELQQDNNSF